MGEQTTTEQAISLLVAEGPANGVVARPMHIWPHTANTNLRHVFGTLGATAWPWPEWCIA